MTIDEFLFKVNDAIVNPIIALLFTVALVVFIWGVVKMIRNSDSETELATGKNNMLYGIIGMFIMISVFFLMQMLVNTFDLDETEYGDPLESLN